MLWLPKTPFDYQIHILLHDNLNTHITPYVSCFDIKSIFILLQ